jgi:Peptidase family M23
VELANPDSACSFRSGFIFVQHSTDFDPNAGIPKYTYPVPSGYSTSTWCVCRSVGTSPHIGHDFVNNDPVINSVAVRRGTISNVQFNGSCGWEVQLRDETGATWRYLHLNAPRNSLYVGAKVEAGTHIGSHSQYPSPGCGTGPHLHLERLSAGGFKDQPGGATCDFRYGSCNYDPYKPWKNGGLRLADGDTAIDSKITELDPIAEVKGKTCRNNSNEVISESALSSELGKISDDGNQLSTSASTQKVDSQRVIVAATSLGDNSENVCANDKECLVQWRVYEKLPNGELKKIMQDQAIRNIVPRVQLDHMFCASQTENNNLVILAKSSAGTWLRKEIRTAQGETK